MLGVTVLNSGVLGGARGGILLGSLLTSSISMVQGLGYIEFRV